jgi:uncharacterized protein YndB with AHSA1/START domain
MAPRTPPKPQIGDDAVQAKTGKTWDEWFALLDAGGAQRLTHKEIVALLSEGHGVGPWWRQMVTVTYEQARGLRAKHETPAGYQVSASRTLAVPAAQVFRAWKDARARARWLSGVEITLRTSAPNKRLRFIIPADDSIVEVYLTAKGEAKTQVAIQHSRLPNAAAVKRQRAFWQSALAALQARLQS